MGIIGKKVITESGVGSPLVCRCMKPDQPGGELSFVATNPAIIQLTSKFTDLGNTYGNISSIKGFNFTLQNFLALGGTYSRI